MVFCFGRPSWWFRKRKKSSLVLWVGFVRVPRKFVMALTWFHGMLVCSLGLRTPEILRLHGLEDSDFLKNPKETNPQKAIFSVAKHHPTHLSANLRLRSKTWSDPKASLLSELPHGWLVQKSQDLRNPS